MQCRAHVPLLLVALLVFAAAAGAGATPNPIREYLAGAELQCEGGQQRTAVLQALQDIVSLPASALQKKRYPDYAGKAGAWDLPTLLARYFVPRKGQTLGSHFYRDVKQPEVQAEVKKILKRLRQSSPGT